MHTVALCSLSDTDIEADSKPTCTAANTGRVREILESTKCTGLEIKNKTLNKQNWYIVTEGLCIIGMG